MWCGADAISEVDYLAKGAADLSRFIYPLGGESTEVIQGAIDTIREHHPRETIWIERAGES